MCEDFARFRTGLLNGSKSRAPDLTPTTNMAIAFRLAVVRRSELRIIPPRRGTSGLALRGKVRVNGVNKPGAATQDISPSTGSSGSKRRPDSIPSNSLERALKILEIIGQKRLGLTNKEVSQQLGIATSSSSYILGRLENEGFVTERRHWALSNRSQGCGNR